MRGTLEGPRPAGALCRGRWCAVALSSPVVVPPACALALLLAILLSFGARAATLPPVESITGLVVSAQRLAAQAGVEILRQGGNAIDAAVAVGYAEAVVNPCCGNIGGGGFMTAFRPEGPAGGHGVFIDFRETAPAAATPDMYLDANGNVIKGASLAGWRAVGVPGTVLGLDTALMRYGSLSRGVVMAPAIRLARDGFTLTASDADILARGVRVLRRDKRAAAIFLGPDGGPLHAGETLRQPALAATLQAIADQGPEAFYHGRIPEAVEAEARKGGGIITAADFAAYKVHEVEPLRCVYRGFTVLSAPPPSSGGVTLCETLNILEGYDLRGLGFHGSQSIHLLTEALRLAFLDRNTELGDPAFVDNPLGRLLSKDYAAHLRTLITDTATPSASLRPGASGPEEKQETTHFSVLDAQGGAVSVTFTIQRRLRCGRDGRRRRVSAERRDGRFHPEAGRAQPVRAGAGRGQCDCSRQAAAVVDGAHHRGEGRAGGDGPGIAGWVADHQRRGSKRS